MFCRKNTLFVDTTIPVAMLAMRLAERAMKKQTAKWSAH